MSLYKPEIKAIEIWDDVLVNLQNIDYISHVVLVY